MNCLILSSQIVHKGSNQCLNRPPVGSGSDPQAQLKLVPCVTEWMVPHLWVASWNTSSAAPSTGYLMGDESMCMDQFDGQVRLMACAGFDRQLWSYNSSSKAIVHNDSGFCLSLSSGPESGDLAVHPCDATYDQQWLLESVPWK